MTWLAFAALAAALLVLAALVARPRLHRWRLHARSVRRILFPFLGTRVSRAALDAALRLAQAEDATLMPAYLANVPLQLSLEAPIPQECGVAMPLLEAIEQHATRLGIPVDTRIERGRTPRHALIQLMEHERFDRLVVPAQTTSSDGFAPSDIAWLLEHSPAEIVVIRPAAEGTPGSRRLVSASRR